MNLAWIWILTLGLISGGLKPAHAEESSTTAALTRAAPATEVPVTTELLVEGAGAESRMIHLEWEAVPHAVRYEVEFQRMLPLEPPTALPEKSSPETPSPPPPPNRPDGTPSLRYQTERAEFDRPLAPGLYQMKVRSFDDRGVPGDWSEPTEFEVKGVELPPPPPPPPPEIHPLTPKKDELILLESDTEGEVKFTWEGSAGFAKVRVEARQKSGEWKGQSEVLTPAPTAEAKMNVPIGLDVEWRVVAFNPEGNPVAESPYGHDFKTVGSKLAPPKIKLPESEFVRELQWEPPPGAESFNYRVERQNKNGEWRQVAAKKGTTKTDMKFPKKAPGGDYRFAVQADSPKRQPSDFAVLEFKVHSGDRSPAAQQEMQLRKSLEKPTSLYVLASYLLTNITYQGQNPETAQTSSFSAIGGTGRLGLGYFKADSAWGYLGIADLSGFTIGSQSLIFPAAELHAARRGYWRTYQLRASGGLFYKALPHVTGNAATASTVKEVAFLGPHLGFDVWRPLTVRHGVQVNARLYYAMMGLHTPNGQPIAPSLSYSFGILGSRRLSENSMGFLGYLYRIDRVSYKATPGTDDATTTSLAAEGEMNQISISGHYLNLVWEWGF